jgi:hypothetical protein
MEGKGALNAEQTKEEFLHITHSGNTDQGQIFLLLSA